MTFEDKQRAKTIIYRLFLCDISELPQWEINRQISMLALFDLNPDEFEEVSNYLSDITMRYDVMRYECSNALKKSVTG